MNEVLTARFTCGILACSAVRNYLNQAKFHYGTSRFDFIESSGWFSRQFVVQGEMELVRQHVLYLQEHLS